MSKIEFNPKGPQKFDKGIITILVKDEKGILYLSEEIKELYNLIGKEALKILGHINEKYEKIDFIPNGTKNYELYFVSSNTYPFILENKKIILQKLEK